MAALVVLVRVPEMLAALLPEAVPVIPATTGADQEYVVEAGTIPLVVFTGVAVNEFPLQMVELIAVTAGVGLTVTVTLNAVPPQDPEVGVTEYTTLMAALVVLVKVPEMFAAFVPEAAPVIPATTGADQEYVVEAGTIPLVVFTGDTEKADPLQTVADMAVMAGVGLTVTVTLKGLPAQLPFEGVTEYTTLMAALVVLVKVPEILAAFVPDDAPVIPATTGADQE
jgi:hypothetical protein